MYDRGIIGYQPEFERVLREVYGREEDSNSQNISMRFRFSKFLAMHTAEAIAVLVEESEDEAFPPA